MTSLDLTLLSSSTNLCGSRVGWMSAKSYELSENLKSFFLVGIRKTSQNFFVLENFHRKLKMMGMEFFCKVMISGSGKITMNFFPSYFYSNGALRSQSTLGTLIPEQPAFSCCSAFYKCKPEITSSNSECQARPNHRETNSDLNCIES